MNTGGHRRSLLGGCVTPRNSRPLLSAPTEAEETIRWWQTQNIQRGGTGGCKIVLNRFLHTPPETKKQDLSWRLLSMKHRWPHQLFTPPPGSAPRTKLVTTLKEKATANWRVGKVCTQELRCLPAVRLPTPTDVQE